MERRRRRLYPLRFGVLDMTRSGIPSGCFVLSRSSIRGSPLRFDRFDPRLRSVTPSASGMSHVAFAVSPPQPRIRRPVIAIFRSRLRQDGRDCSEGIYDREAIKEGSRGLQPVDPFFVGSSTRLENDTRSRHHSPCRRAKPNAPQFNALRNF